MFIVVKKLKVGGWQDGWARFQTWNLHPAATQWLWRLLRAQISEISVCSSSRDCDWYLCPCEVINRNWWIHPVTTEQGTAVAHRSLWGWFGCRGQISHHAGCDDQRVFNFYSLYLELVMFVELHAFTCGVVSPIASVMDPRQTADTYASANGWGRGVSANSRLMFHKQIWSCSNTQCKPPPKKRKGKRNGCSFAVETTIFLQIQPFQLIGGSFTAICHRRSR